MGDYYGVVASSRYHGHPLSVVPPHGVWTGFMDNTTAHGIPHVRNARGPIKKILWTLATLGCVAGLIQQSYSIINKYIAYDVVVKVAVEQAREILFPAVTVCNNSPVMGHKLSASPALSAIFGSSKRRKRSLPPGPPTGSMLGQTGSTVTHSAGGTQAPGPDAGATQPPGPDADGPQAPGPDAGGTQAPGPDAGGTQAPTPDAGGTQAPGPDTEEEGYGNGGGRGFQEGYGSGNKREHFQKRLQLIEALANMDYAEKSQIGFTAEDLIIDCEYAGTQCNSTTDFSTFYNNWYGNCFTFNSNWNTSLLMDGELTRSYRPGPQYGLSLTFNVDQDSYIGDIAQTAGLHVVVHSQHRMPFPEDEGITAVPGYQTLVGITKLIVSREGGKYGDCTDITYKNYSRNLYEELYPVNYSAQACYKTCYQHHVIKECGCGDAPYPLQGKFTTHRDVSACNMTSEEEASCVEGVLEHYANDSLGCHCPTACFEESFNVRLTNQLWPSENYRSTLFEALASSNEKIKRVLNSREDPDKYKKNLGKVVIFFQEFNQERISETPLYSLTSLISDMGGILGLFIGFSFLTIGEFLEVGIDLLVVLACKLCHRGKLAPKDVKGSLHESPCYISSQKSVQSASNCRLDIPNELPRVPTEPRFNVWGK